MALNINGTTGISGVDGSASNPSIQGTDANTGVAFGADILDLVTGGNTRFKVGAAGQLGVAGANYGTSGQALVSQGASAAPQWGTISGGLAMADQWRYIGQITQSNTHTHFPSSNGWERIDSKLGIGSNPLGTGMTQSGGIFTFPSTGYYYIMFQACAKVDNDSCELFAMIRATDDNSAYDNVSEYLSTIQNQCTPNYNTANVNYLARVTNISNHKVQFRCQNSGLSVTWMGESTKNRIAATFLKVGDI